MHSGSAEWLNEYTVVSIVPSASTATPVGVSNVADVAAPPSPLNNAVPVPAMVVMMPVVLVTMRIR